MSFFLYKILMKDILSGRNMKKLNVGLFNDSFPPTIDGVANVTVNYARIIQSTYGNAVVATPYYPKVCDEYPFEVVRYPSTYLNKSIGYRAGMPFDPLTINKLANKQLDIIHSHCPFVSTLLARMVRTHTHVPIVFTYHTKFDIDVDNAMASDLMRKASLRFILNNINSCDEVWVVSNGAGENLRSLGYRGDYCVMENGTDFSKGRSPEAETAALKAALGVSGGETVFLFVGRLMWYKGFRLSLDSLRMAKTRGARFKFIIVGDGVERKEIEAYAKEIGLEDDCVFTGAIRDRETLRIYFTLADLFLFPSTFDTNGIVVREAAACYCPSLLIRESCAAEGIAHMETGILTDKTAADMVQMICYACENRGALKAIGENAAEKLYLSWEDAVAKAYERYAVIIDNYKSKPQFKEISLEEDMNAIVESINDQMEAAKIYVKELFWDTRDWVDKLKNDTDERFKKASGQLKDMLTNKKL